MSFFVDDGVTWVLGVGVGFAFAVEVGDDGGVSEGGVGVGGTVGALAGAAVREETRSRMARMTAINMTAATMALSRPRRRLG